MQHQAEIVKLLVKLAIIILPFFLVGSCKQETPPPRKFSIPVLYNTDNLDSIPFSTFVPKHMLIANSNMIGKYSFCDSIDLNLSKWNYKEDDLIYLEDGWIPIEQNFDVNGFEIIVDSKNPVEYSPSNSWKDHFYPVYLVNSSDTIKYFFSDFSPESIMEAMDTNRVWRPIEYRSLFAPYTQAWLKVHPKEFILFLFPKYEGDYETKLRLRFKLRDNIMVSQFFLGSVYMDQFKVEDGTIFEYNLYKYPQGASKRYFYGGYLPPYVEWETTSYKRE